MFRWPWSKSKPLRPPSIFDAPPPDPEPPWIPPTDLNNITAEWYPGAVFRQLHGVLMRREAGDLAEAVLWPALPILKPFVEAMAPYRRLIDSPVDKADLIDDLWDLYALSRVNEFLLMHVQTHDPGVNLDPDYVWSPMGTYLSLEDYDAFMQGLGFEPVGTAPFHPFFHEITQVTTDQDLGDRIEIERVDWPGYRFGELMFSRVGVAVRVGPHSGVDGMAARSNLYSIYHRRFRPTVDLSMGWGSNSQWRTAFRRDYLSEGRFFFNADGRYELDETYEAQVWQGEQVDIRENGLSLEERISLLRHRCLVRTRTDSREFWPFDDSHSELAPSEHLPPK